MLAWTAGVKGEVPSGLKGSALAKGNRLKVDGYNRLENYDNIFAIGDVAAMASPDRAQGHNMVAQVAIQQGKLLAENLLHYIKHGEFRKAFRYKDKGSMSAIGMKNAVAEIGGAIWKGWFAWLLWSTVHLFSIIGLKNKLMVAVNWMTRYLAYEKANRLIIRKFKPAGETRGPAGKDKRKKEISAEGIPK